MDSILQKMADLRNELAKLRSKYTDNGGYSYKTADGTTFVTEQELAKDVHLYVMDETGNKIDAPVGTYEIEGIGKVEVGENGMVANITASEPQPGAEPGGEPGPMNGEPPMPGANVSISEEDMMKIVAMVVATLKEQMSGDFSAVTSLKEKVDSQFESITKSIGTLADVVEKLGETPSEPKPRKSAFEFAQQGPSREDRIQNLSETLKKLKTPQNQ